ncbi:MAG: alpha/beta hydrolase [Ktedonobacteraceae bacterium]|nr:alpha/beta hydrolase [Ktedonobacteraceae bacterium]
MTIETETWRHRDIITNGIRMHYVTQGEGPLIVLLHGFPEFWYSWRIQIPFLADLGYTVVAPDLRGYNDSDKPRTGYTVSTLLRDIVGLIKGLERDKAVIVGHDWGGALAWQFAIRYPQMTEKLIGLNAPPPWTFAREMGTLKQMRKSWYIFFFQLPWLPELALGRNHAEAIGRMLYSSAVQKAAFPPDVLERYRDAMSKPGVLTAAINYYRKLPRWPIRSKQVSLSGTVSAPTLLIWGEQDIALGIEMTHGLEQWVPDIEVKYLPDSGHWVQQEKPEQVNQFIAEFLRKQEG